MGKFRSGYSSSDQPKKRSAKYRATIIPEGRKAAREGKTVLDCPYPPSGMGKFYYWCVGWWEEENILAVEEQRPVREFGGMIVLIGDNIERQEKLKRLANAYSGGTEL